MIKRIVVCSRCSQQVMPDGTAEKLQLPEFRTDHGPACVCMSCVVSRGERRIAEAQAAAWGVK